MVLSKFPWLQDNTRLVRHNDSLYKLKLKYQSESLKGINDVAITQTEAHTEIEQCFRALLYLDQEKKQLKAVKTKHFIVQPLKIPWSFPKKYSNYTFQQDGKVMKVHDYMIELTISVNNEASKTNVEDIATVKNEVRNDSANPSKRNEKSSSENKDKSGSSKQSPQTGLEEQPGTSKQTSNTRDKTSTKPLQIKESVIALVPKDSEQAKTIQSGQFGRTKDGKLFRVMASDSPKQDPEKNARRKSVDQNERSRSVEKRSLSNSPSRNVKIRNNKVRKLKKQLEFSQLRRDNVRRLRNRDVSNKYERFIQTIHRNFARRTTHTYSSPESFKDTKTLKKPSSRSPSKRVKKVSVNAAKSDLEAMRQSRQSHSQTTAELSRDVKQAAKEDKIMATKRLKKIRPKVERMSLRCAAVQSKQSRPTVKGVERMSHQHASVQSKLHSTRKHVQRTMSHSPTSERRRVTRLSQANNRKATNTASKTEDVTSPQVSMVHPVKRVTKPIQSTNSPVSRSTRSNSQTVDQEQQETDRVTQLRGNTAVQAYRDFMQHRSDRYTVEQAERAEVDKLQQLYQPTGNVQPAETAQGHGAEEGPSTSSTHKDGSVTNPRTRRTKRSPRRSGIWGTIMDNLVTPSKKFMFEK